MSGSWQVLDLKPYCSPCIPNMIQQQKLSLATSNNGIGKTDREEFSLILSRYFFPYHPGCTNQPSLNLEIGEMHDMNVFHLTASSSGAETEHHSSYS